MARGIEPKSQPRSGDSDVWSCVRCRDSAAIRQPIDSVFLKAQTVGKFSEFLRLNSVPLWLIQKMKKMDAGGGQSVIKQKLFCVDHNPDDVFVRLFHRLVGRGAGWAGCCSRHLAFDMSQRDA
jgi:hypothetical protein